MSKLEKRSALISQIKALQDELTTVDEAIIEDLKKEVKPQGSTTVEYEGSKVTVTIPVTVKWDQGLLHGIAKRIQAEGDNPESYIDYKLSVKEASYKAWPEQMQQVFIAARTISLGKTRLEVKQ